MLCDLWLSRRDDGGWLLEAHPVDEFPATTRRFLLPAAISASLKGLAHELRNPLAGLKGAAQCWRAVRSRCRQWQRARTCVDDRQRRSSA
jgi:nitrogen-specific signal transduction histidine kinase